MEATVMEMSPLPKLDPKTVCRYNVDPFDSC